MVTLTPFLKSIQDPTIFSKLSGIGDINFSNPRTVSGTATRDATKSSSFIANRSNLDTILTGLQIPSFRNQTFADNQIKLGEASVDISNALNDQIKIREEQRKEDQNAIKTVFDFANSNNQRLSKQVTSLGQSSIDASQAIDASKASSLLAPVAAIFGGSLLTAALILGGGFLILRKIK